MPNDKGVALGFWSYTHFDNQNDQESLVKLCHRIKGEVRIHSGQSFDIFIDQGLHAGQQWKDDLESALEEADVLIPIVTPSYFASSQCYDEYVFFQGQELDFGRSNLIAPIYYITCREIENKSDEGLSEWAMALRKRQYADFRFIRTGSRHSVQAARAIEKFALGLVASLEESRSSRVDGEIDESLHLPATEDEPARIAELVDGNVIKTFSILPQTQKNLVSFLYTHYREYIGVDDLYSAFTKKVGQQAVGSPTELHYRLQVLQFQGFIVLRVIGHRTTVVTIIPEVGKLLRDHKLIRT